MPLTVHRHKDKVKIPGLTLSESGNTFYEVLGNQDKKQPMTCGLSSLKKGSPKISFDYPYDEFTIILEGEMTLEDTKSGEVLKLKAGDIVRIDKGMSVKWSSETEGKAFYVTPKVFGEAY